ncbi:Uncharacterised protein [Phocoenobacter uteri]|uniref:Uncharacterized protein n=1 Tax=Phocoenobacter uteri TaxID=146806 RepID=A0A379CC32_9PAST|nr:hypothetical protein [Phocoenobacter uteri]SUB59286.1 Uncharacterised protein [Phocoenobacter uteri]
MKNENVLITAQQVMAITGLNHIGMLKLELKGELPPETTNPKQWRLSDVMAWKHSK